MKKQYDANTYHQHLLQLLPESNFTLDIYNGTEQPCQITCLDCGTTHTFAYAALIARRARRNCKNVCKNCENNGWRENQRQSENKAKYLLEKKQTIQLIGNLQSWSSRANTTWLCTKCQHTFERSPFVMFSQKSINCPWCETHPFIYTEEMLLQKSQELWGTEYSILDCNSLKNKNGSRRIIVSHNTCGFKYSVSAYNFLHGQGCPKCKKSHGEKKVRDYLTKYGFIFQEQFTIYTQTHQYLKLDFYLEQNNGKFAIEYNGIQHYQPVGYFGGEQGFIAQQTRDSIKAQYCKNNNIDLIIIPYNDESIINSEQLAQRLNGQAL